MAYDASNLSVLAYANGFTMWHYTTSDDAPTCETIGYFNKARDMLRVGDMIIANFRMDVAPEGAILFVFRNKNDVVETSTITLTP